MFSSKKKRKPKKTKTRMEKDSTQLFFDRIALYIYGKVAATLAKRYNLEKKIKQAGLNIHPVVFMSRQLLKLFISTLFSVFMIMLGAAIFAGKPAIFYFIYISIFAIIPILVFYLGFLQLSSKISERRTGVDSELPFFASYLSAMSTAGLSPEKVIETVANIKTFKYIGQEARLILRNIKVFGMDPLTAIEDVARDHPSPHFRDFMMGYVTAVRSGGDVRHYLELRTQSYFIEKSRELESTAEKIGAILDAYIAIFVMAGITVNIMVASQGTLSGIGSLFGGFGDISILYLFNFFLLPLISLVMIVAVASILPKYPVTYLEPYISLMYSIPIGLVVMSFLMLMGGGEVFLRPSVTSLVYAILAIGVGIIVMLIPPYFMWRRIELREKGIIENFASFLQDLSEVRKTGLSPERSILYLVNRPYGSFTPVLKKLATALYVGMDLYKAVKISVLNYKNWFVKAILRFLVDAIEYGGGTPIVLDSIASYARKLADLELGLRKSLKSRIFLPYLGIILNVVTVALVIMLTANSIAIFSKTMPSASTATIVAQRTISPYQIANLTLTLSIGIMINAVFAGLLVGKAGTMTMAGGFKHSILMLVIAIIGSLLSIYLFLAPVFATIT